MQRGQMPLRLRSWLVSGLLCGGTLLLAAPSEAQTGSRLPPTPPTSAANPNNMTAPIAGTPVRGDNLEHHRARVSYENGLLEVHADNSSLNQILRDISRQTGMRIIGGVADQRVFGSYGPAPAATVLQTLLDPTSTNMLLQETPTHEPKQLVLSPRAGGPTPPGPSSPSYDAYENEPDLGTQGQPSTAPAGGAAASASSASYPASGAPATGAPASGAQPPAAAAGLPPLGPVLGNPGNVSPTASTLPVTNSVPISTLGTPSTAQPVSGIVDAPNPPPATSTTGGYTSQTQNTNPNTAPPATAAPAQPTGVKTPQQIYEELKQMQQRTQGQQANPQGSSSPQ